MFGLQNKIISQPIYLLLPPSQNTTLPISPGDEDFFLAFDQTIQNIPIPCMERPSQPEQTSDQVKQIISVLLTLIKPDDPDHSLKRGALLQVTKKIQC